MYDFALDADTMFQRSMAKRIQRFVELEFKTADSISYRGYITGLDEDWLQIFDRETSLNIWLNLCQLVSVSETGLTLRDSNLDDETKLLIENFTSAIRKKADQAEESYKNELQGSRSY
jgi:hypothetical protein